MTVSQTTWPVYFKRLHVKWLVIIAPAHRAGDPSSNPGPGENFSLKLLKEYVKFDHNNVFQRARKKYVKLDHNSTFQRTESI